MVNDTLRRGGVLGVYDRVMCFWQSGVKRGAAMAVLSAALLGCSNTESLSSQAKTETQAEAPRPIAANEFTTKDKPTKTIETPWGPREIYDPAQDEEFRAIYRKWFDADFKNYNPYQLSPKNSIETHSTLSNGSYFSDSMLLVQVDYLRSGCALTVQGTCFYNEYIFKTDCKAEHKFGSLELSKCEAENITYLSVGNGVAGGCPFKGERLHTGDSFKKESDYELSLSKFTDFECRIWRNEDGADYWKDLIPDPMKLPR